MTESERRKEFRTPFYGVPSPDNISVLEAIKNLDNKLSINNPRFLQTITRLGLAGAFLSVGDQLTIPINGKPYKWDVIGIDHDTPADETYTHSVTIQLHDCLQNLQFSARQAAFYFENGLAAGNYTFTVTEHTWNAGNVGKTFAFTLANAIPEGGQIVLQANYGGLIAGTTLKTFASSVETEAIETATITEGSTGTSLGSISNSEGNNINSMQRALLGSNNYGDSAMRQWLNSDKSAGSVWAPKSRYDRPPSWVSDTAGFLNGLDADLVHSVGKVVKKTALNTITDGGGSIDTEETFFLLSRSEIYGGNEVAGGDGAPYAYYKDFSNLPSAGTGTDANRIKYLNGQARYWWLRSPLTSYAYSVRVVGNDGDVNSHNASNADGVAPACCII